MPEPKQSPDGPASAPAATTEPPSAILAEIREYFDLLKRGLIPDNVDRMTTRQRHQFWADRIEAAVRRERVEREFAHKKVEEALSDEISIRDEKIKRSAHGNAAAMREALEKIADMKFHLGDFAEPVGGDSSAIYENAKWDGKKFLGREIPAWWGAGWRECLSRAIDIARAALSAPARNCDRFATAEEAYSAWMSAVELDAICEGGDHA